MRILKGQEILPDDSTLVQHKISDGNTVNIVIEPDATITIQVKYNSNIFSHTIFRSSSVQQLKEFLYDQEQVIFPPVEFDLVYENDGELITLDDTTLPFLMYDVKEGAKVTVVRSNYEFVLENMQRKRVYITIDKRATMGDLRKRALNFAAAVSEEDMRLFIKSGVKYKKLFEPNNMKISDVLSGQEILYIVENTLHVPLKFVQQFSSKKIIGIQDGDTVLSVKLRGQDQLGIPARKIKVCIGIKNRFGIIDYNKECSIYHKLDSLTTSYSLELEQ